MSSPFLRTLQTAAYLINSITNSKDKILFHHDYLSANLKLKDGDNPLTNGVLATTSQDTIISGYLSSNVSTLTSLSTHLPLLSFPDKNFSKRYIAGLQDLFSHHATPNTVLILVSHHKGIPEIARLKYQGVPDAKKLRSASHIEEPNYCCTLSF